MTARYEIIDVEQGSPEWLEARRGMPTASRYKDVLAQGEGKMRAKYMRQLVGEIITKKPMKTYSNERMEDGKEHEPWLRTQYQFACDTDIDYIGFVKMNPELCLTGCSPDGFVGSEGMVEFKTVLPENLVEILDTGKIPMAVHQPQIQGCLWVTGRRWCDLTLGWPDMPLKIVRIGRDEPLMAKIANEVKMFSIELRRMAERIGDM
jgi:hypothetical protein